ncbi:MULTISPECIES: DNA-binding protein [unclassified Pantoea]|uniref:DNA-binding protein n=1 Tax=unclassified Pantoea TaxID=2630326 RepID=UPI001CD74D79|nr:MULTISPECIES: DNA-binding protein [unclassified Pantoea]MCA1175876.1 DNA-binding protein [Pantoea sp. alder69]MCA1250708.1 DNA-binding protein [Pantoea sp. alder70]MCA1265078.1 DNA-binding protein [Pantoea sp. alder81]
MEFEFTLRFQLSEAVTDDEALERLGAAGCTDALVGTGVAGKLSLMYCREAENAQQAIRDALAEVTQALPDAELIEAAPDLVGLTDIAELIGVSRQNMRKLMLTHSPQFPRPIHDGKTALWHLVDVVEWPNQRGSSRVTPGISELAYATLQLNLQQALQRYAHCL